MPIMGGGNSKLNSEFGNLQEYVFMDLDDASAVEKEAIRKILFPSDEEALEKIGFMESQDEDEQENSDFDDYSHIENVTINFDFNQTVEAIEGSWSLSEWSDEREADDECHLIRTWDNPPAEVHYDTADCEATAMGGGADSAGKGCTLFQSMEYPQINFQIPIAPWLCWELTSPQQQFPAAPAPSHGFYPYTEPNQPLPSTPLTSLSPACPNTQFQTFWTEVLYQPWQVAAPQFGDSSLTYSEPPAPMRNGSAFGGSQLVSYAAPNFLATDCAVCPRKRKRSQKNKNRHGSFRFTAQKWSGHSGDEHCRFCWRNNETRAVYTSHTLRNAFGQLTCPILMRHVCPICKQTGLDAHTERFCPVRSANEGEPGPSSLWTRKGALASVGRNPLRA